MRPAKHNAKMLSHNKSWILCIRYSPINPVRAIYPSFFVFYRCHFSRPISALSLSLSLSLSFTLSNIHSLSFSSFFQTEFWVVTSLPKAAEKSNSQKFTTRRQIGQQGKENVATNIRQRPRKCLLWKTLHKISTLFSSGCMVWFGALGLLPK
jgi:hypothetical protein